MKLFPGAYFHLGGDECPKKRWKECPKCQARMKALGLEDERMLQGWVVRHFADYLAKKGRRAMAWDEVIESGMCPTNVLIQCWRDRKHAAKAYIQAEKDAAHRAISHEAQAHRRGSPAAKTPHHEAKAPHHEGKAPNHEGKAPRPAANAQRPAGKPQAKAAPRMMKK